MQWLRNWRSFPREQKFLCFEAFLVVVLIRFSLWLLPFRRILEFTERYLARNFGKIPTGLKPLTIAQTVSKAARRVPKASCLTQAFATRLLLGRRGISSTICYGAKQVSGKFEAHAWVKVGSETIIGKHLPQEFSNFKPSAEHFSRLPD